MAVQLGELDEVDPTPPEDEIAPADRAEVLLADLIMPAKPMALEKLGEGERGLGIALVWLRSKLSSFAADSMRGTRTL